jgi:hypothetical protein
MLLTLSNLINVLATPTEVFNSLKDQPRWLLTFAVISLISMVVGWFMFPMSQHITYIILSSKLSGTQLDQAIAFSERFKYIGLLFVPVTLLIKWVIVGALIYLLCILFETPNELKYRTIFSVVVYSEMILLFMSVVNVLILYVKGIGSVQHLVDLQAVPGLDLLLKDKISNLPLFTFLNSFNVFSIWYVITLTVGISVVTGYRKLKASLIVTGVWVLLVTFQVIMSFISSNSPLNKGM